MSQVFSPYGLRVLKNLGEGPFSAGMHTYPVFASSALATTGCFFGDPVGLQAGTVVPLTASPTNALPGVIGIFQGCSWQDPFRGFVNSQYLPPNIYSTGATQVLVKVQDYPWTIMRVQSDGTLNYAAVTPFSPIGLNAQLMGFGNGNTVTGNSRVYLSSGAPSALPPGQPPLTAGNPPGPTATYAVRITGFVVDAAPSPGAGSIPGDPFTDMLVTWNFGVDRYQNATGG
jgi:hypothetical protein